MNMIRKIAVTASSMLFVLAQLFSFYTIYTSHQEKITLLREHEGKAFADSAHEFGVKLSEAAYKGLTDTHIAIYLFRETMPTESALYLEETELFNNSRYAFSVNNLETDDRQYPCNYRMEKINGRRLQIFYTKSSPGSFHTKASYLLLHVVDITEFYTRSFQLVIRELLTAFLASVVMGILLVYFIRKITKPLQAVNEAQRQLIGSMSHELKTPLTAIRGYSETLLGVKLSKEQTEKALSYINRESARLSRLSEKMMELTRLYEPECKVMLQDISVETLFDAAAESVRHRLSAQGMTLVYEGEFQGITMRLDEDLMISFLINLINNSIMASEEGSRIFMGADADAIWVRDEGCGIPKEELDKVRKAFYRVDKSRSRKSGNMGLGLALCEQIAAVHHGGMEIESTVGTGTKVIFTKRLQRVEYLET